MANTELRDLVELLYVLRVHLGRSDVREQLLILGLVILVAGLLTGLMRVMLFTRVARFIQETTEKTVWGDWSQPMARVALNLLLAVTFPVLGLLLLEVAVAIRFFQGQLFGLLLKLQGVFSTVLLFAILTTLLYASFDSDQIKRFTRRLTLPLLAVVIAGQILAQFVDLRRVVDVVILDFFGSPLTLGALLLATLGLYFYIDILNALQTALLNGLNQLTKADSGASEATLTLIRYGLIVVGVVFALNQLRLNPTTLAAVTGGLSIGIGFGLREILSNFVSGILLLLERSLHPGDVIQVDGELCIVERLSIRATTVRNLYNIELVIPNQTFFTDTIKTYTGSNKDMAVSLYIKTSCEIEPQKVLDLLQETAASHPDVLSTPAPMTFLLGYTNNEASFELYFWFHGPLNEFRISSEVRTQIWNVLQEYNVSLPLPQVELHFPRPSPVSPPP